MQVAALQKKYNSNTQAVIESVHITQVPFVWPSLRLRKSAAYFCAASPASLKVCPFNQTVSQPPTWH